MPILRNIPISLTVKDIMAGGKQRALRPELVKQAEEMIALGATLWQPVAIHDRFAVQGVAGKEVYLAPATPTGSQARLQVGPKADLLQEAREVLVAVGTIGPALEEEVQRLQREGENLKSYLLDSTGVAALGAVGEGLRCLAEEVATEQGWGVSPALSPGSLVGWPLRGQRELCALLPLDEIGVRLNEHCVLEPHKSFSSLIGLGPGYESGKVGSVCKYCALQDTCWRRREDPS